jgi:hypothetical protein
MKKPALPANRVSRNAKQAPKCDGRTGMLIVSTEGSSTRINCGWFKTHARRKVREDAAENHIEKNHHGGNAIWL